MPERPVLPVGTPVRYIGPWPWLAREIGVVEAVWPDETPRMYAVAFANRHPIFGGSVTENEIEPLD